jgi:hypothetical protein
MSPAPRPFVLEFGNIIASLCCMNKRFEAYPNLCSELVSIHPKHSSSDGKAIQGNLEAIGEWTALVLTDTPITCGAEVRIHASKGNSFNGIVESCSLDEPLGWSVEVRLKPASRWSYRRFKPQHFLSLSSWPGIETRKSA